jgi:hypothetical protein
MDTWYIAEGGLHGTDAGGATRTVQSPFVQEALQRNERARQLDGWKTAQPDDDGGGRMVPRAVLWGSGRSGGGALTHRFRYVTRGDVASLYYVIFVGNATALFRYFPQQDREIRLFHGAAMQCLGLAFDPASQHLVLAAGNADGTASLEMVDGEGRRRGPITGGDAIDAAPSVSARDPGTVYYQSSGVARHAQTGQAAAIGPAALLKLDTKTANLATVLEHKDYDFLAPREDRSGNLWFIRRPYEKTAGEVALSAGKDAIMFPWRVAKGVFGFLDVFSKIYGREPMKPSGGPQHTNLKPDMGSMFLHGRMVALNEVRYDTGRGGGLVPGSWELVCRNRKGQDYVAARHVVSFDVGDDDRVIYSNGFAVFRLVDGDWQEVARANLIENVCAA